ncbi:unnamed protein product, partial [Adineta ricciae]
MRKEIRLSDYHEDSIWPFRYWKRRTLSLTDRSRGHVNSTNSHDKIVTPSVVQYRVNSNSDASSFYESERRLFTYYTIEGENEEEEDEKRKRRRRVGAFFVTPCCCCLCACGTLAVVLLMAIAAILVLLLAQPRIRTTTTTSTVTTATTTSNCIIYFISIIAMFFLKATTSTTSTTTSSSSSSTSSTSSSSSTSSTSSTTTTTSTSSSSSTSSTSTSTSSSSTTTTSVTTTTTAFDSCMNLRWNKTGAVVAGSSSGNAANKFNTPACIYMNENDTFYVCDAGNNRIQEWTENASSGTTKAGSSSGTAGSSSSLLNTPVDVFFDIHGYMYVTDTENHRIQRFLLNSSLATTVAGTGSKSSALT